MGAFFIDTTSGQVATHNQLRLAQLTGPDGKPVTPWFRINATGDATTLWYAVLRKQVKGVHIGALAIRHSEHHASRLQDGWQEVPIEEIGVPGTAGAPGPAVQADWSRAASS